MEVCAASFFLLPYTAYLFGGCYGLLCFDDNKAPDPISSTRHFSGI